MYFPPDLTFCVLSQNLFSPAHLLHLTEGRGKQGGEPEHAIAYGDRNSFKKQLYELKKM